MKIPFSQIGKNKSPVFNLAVGPKWRDSDLEWCFGDEPVFVSSNELTMIDLVVAIGSFPSRKQARNNGWDKPIPLGFSEIVIGRNRNKKFLFIWNPIVSWEETKHLDNIPV